MKHIVWFIMGMLVFGADTPKGKQAEILQGIEIGIESITVNEDRSLDVAVYMYNTIPVAGFQANLFLSVHSCSFCVSPFILPTRLFFSRFFLT